MNWSELLREWAWSFLEIAFFGTLVLFVLAAVVAVGSSYLGLLAGMTARYGIVPPLVLNTTVFLLLAIAIKKT